MNIEIHPAIQNGVVGLELMRTDDALEPAIWISLDDLDNALLNQVGSDELRSAVDAARDLQLELESTLQ